MAATRTARLQNALEDGYETLPHLVSVIQSTDKETGSAIQDLIARVPRETFLSELKNRFANNTGGNLERFVQHMLTKYPVTPPEKPAASQTVVLNGTKVEVTVEGDGSFKAVEVQ